jgi:hypothetical protein
MELYLKQKIVILNSLLIRRKAEIMPKENPDPKVVYEIDIIKQQLDNLDFFLSMPKPSIRTTTQLSDFLHVLSEIEEKINNLTHIDGHSSGI